MLQLWVRWAFKGNMLGNRWRSRGERTEINHPSPTVRPTGAQTCRLFRVYENVTRHWLSPVFWVTGIDGIRPQVSSVSKGDDGCMFMSALFGGQQCEMLIDTGANVFITDMQMLIDTGANVFITDMHIPLTTMWSLKESGHKIPGPACHREDSTTVLLSSIKAWLGCYCL